MGTSWRDGAREISEQLAKTGLDIVWPFPSRLLGEVAEEEVRPGLLGLLVGNTRALWPRLVEALERDPSLRGQPDPVDRYCEQRIATVLESAGASWQARWAHTLPPDAYPIQALAHAAGLCDIAPCRLAIHERYGPWFALRAAVVIDVAGPSDAPDPPAVCAPCSAPCRRPFAAALAGGASLEGDWRRWLAVRDACPVGREHRYREPQLEYHYTKQRSLLARR